MSSLLPTLLVLSVAVHVALAMNGYSLLDDMKKKFGSATQIIPKYSHPSSVKFPSSSNFDIPDLRKQPGAKVTSTSSIDHLTSTKNCTNNDFTTQNVKLDDRTCVWEAFREKAENGNCNNYHYHKKTVTSTSSPVADVNNGVAKCTKKKCGSTEEPTTVDCLEAFGKDRLLKIESTVETH